MDVALYAILAVLLCGASAALSWAHVGRIRRATSGDARALAIALKKVPEADRLAELLVRAPEGSWEQALAREALAAVDDRGRVAAVNDALFDVEHALRQGAGWSPSALRIAIFSGILLGGLAYREAHALAPALGIVGIGAIAALVSLEAGRIARRAAAEQRAAVDALITTVLGKLVESAVAPERRSRRRSQR